MSPASATWAGTFKTIILHGSYIEVFGVLQHIVRSNPAPEFVDSVSSALEIALAAYRVLDKNTIVSIGSEAEAETITRAFADLAANEFHGARQHLRNAAESLSTGKAADSIRESIHAVESVARVLEPSGEFSKALARLETKAKIHGALKQGFSSIYGLSRVRTSSSLKRIMAGKDIRTAEASLSRRGRPLRQTGRRGN